MYIRSLSNTAIYKKIGRKILDMHARNLLPLKSARKEAYYYGKDTIKASGNSEVGNILAW